MKFSNTRTTILIYLMHWNMHGDVCISSIHLPPPHDERNGTKVSGKLYARFTRVQKLEAIHPHTEIVFFSGENCFALQQQHQQRKLLLIRLSYQSVCFGAGFALCVSVGLSALCACGLKPMKPYNVCWNCFNEAAYNAHTQHNMLLYKLFHEFDVYALFWQHCVCEFSEENSKHGKGLVQIFTWVNH